VRLVLGQELVLACDLEDEDFFQLSGLLPNQMLYLVWLTTGRLGACALRCSVDTPVDVNEVFPCSPFPALAFRHMMNMGDRAGC